MPIVQFIRSSWSYCAIESSKFCGFFVPLVYSILLGKSEIVAEIPTLCKEMRFYFTYFLNKLQDFWLKYEM